MGEEAGFLSVIRQTPADETARLVYADWLDEQGDPVNTAKAAFIRLELRMAETPEQSLRRVHWLNELQKLAATLNPAWLAIVSHPTLERCRLSFRFVCPKQWDKLAPTADDKVRSCESCNRLVHYCDTIHEAREHAAQRRCVAVSLAIVRQPDDLYPRGPIPRSDPPPLSTDQISRLAVAGQISLDPPIEPEPPLPEARPEWVPPTQRRPLRPPRRAKGRGRHRNMQRQDWEEEA